MTNFKQTSATHTRRRDRGIAMVLVVVAVAMALILSLSFLSTQATTTGIAHNVSNHSQARHIAESGMNLAIAEIKANASWRDDHPNGAWTTAQTLLGGTFIVTVEDGIDTDGDGIVDGDGDLTDDTTEPVTISVKGTFDGMTHTARAIITGGSGPLLLQTAAVADKVETKKGIVDSWDSSKGSYLSTKSSNAVVSTNSKSKNKLKVKDNGIIKGDVFVGVGGNTNQVVEVSKGGSITGSKNNLTAQVTIPGVVAPDIGASVGNLSYSSGLTIISSDVYCDSFKISGSAIVKITGHRTIVANGEFNMKDSAQIQIAPDSSLNLYVGSITEKPKLKIEGSAKINATTDQPHLVIVYNVSKERLEIKGSSQVYALFVMPSAELKVMDTAQLFGASRTRNLKVEGNGQYHLDVRPSSVMTALTYIDRGGADYGLFAEDKFEFKGKSQVKGLSGTARITTNATYFDAVKLKDEAVITGDFYVGPGADPNIVIKYENKGKIVGTVNTPTDGVNLPDIDIPDIGESIGDKSYSSGTTILDTDLHVNKLTVSGSAILRIKGDVSIVADGEVRIQDNAQIIFFNAASTLSLYVSGKCIIKGEALVNIVSADPDKLALYHDSIEAIEFQDSAQIYGHVIVSNAELKLSNNSQFWGTIRAFRAKLEDNSIANILTTAGEGPADSGTQGAGGGIKVQWIEKP